MDIYGTTLDISRSMTLLMCLLGVSRLDADSVEHASDWADWWSYDGISGPEYWGLVNSDWKLCERGRYQSPVNIQPHNLVFDPLLTQIFFNHKEVSVTIINTGHDITIRLNKGDVSILGGPLAYTYRIYEVKIHFGSSHGKGSEHTVAGKAFPVEFQLLGYNEDLYGNASSASKAPHGLAGLAVFAQINNQSSDGLNTLFETLFDIQFKGNTSTTSLDLGSLLPETIFYMTYDGSITFPPCHEVVTWIIMNRPITITKSQFDILRQINQVDGDSPPISMENNFRKPVPLSNRTVRTNINIPANSMSDFGNSFMKQADEDKRDVQDRVESTVIPVLLSMLSPVNLQKNVLVDMCSNLERVEDEQCSYAMGIFTIDYVTYGTLDKHS